MSERGSNEGLAFGLAGKLEVVFQGTILAMKTDLSTGGQQPLDPQGSYPVLFVKKGRALTQELLAGILAAIRFFPDSRHEIRLENSPFTA